MDDKLDFLMDQRRFPRFQSSAFQGVPVRLKPLPPFFGEPTQGKLLDLSAGGMAILIEETIPKDAKLKLELTFPDHSILESNIRVCYSKAEKKEFLIGLEFLDIPDFMRNKISRMSEDFLGCENRIKKNAINICQLDCAFFSICDKHQKTKLEKELDITLQMKLNQIE